VLVERLESIHPNLFWRVSEADFRQQVDTLDADIPYLTDNQIIMGFARIAAHGGGHTRLWLLQHATGFHLYPLRLYWFSDGLYVIAAQDEALVGARVIGIGNATVQEAYEQFMPLISNDNDTALLLWSPLYFIMPEVLAGLGIIDDMDQPNFVLERSDGAPFTYDPSPISVSAYTVWNHGFRYLGYPQRSSDGSQRQPLYLSRYDDENFWFAYLEDMQTLYIQYNAVQSHT
jgi:hypothetical protein